MLNDCLRHKVLHELVSNAMKLYLMQVSRKSNYNKYTNCIHIILLVSNLNSKRVSMNLLKINQFTESYYSYSCTRSHEVYIVLVSNVMKAKKISMNFTVNIQIAFIPHVTNVIKIYVKKECMNCIINIQIVFIVLVSNVTNSYGQRGLFEFYCKYRNSIYTTCV